MNLYDAVEVVSKMNLDELEESQAAAIEVLLDVGVGMNAFLLGLLPYAEVLDAVYAHVEGRGGG